DALGQVLLFDLERHLVPAQAGTPGALVRQKQESALRTQVAALREPNGAHRGLPLAEAAKAMRHWIALQGLPDGRALEASLRGLHPSPAPQASPALAAKDKANAERLMGRPLDKILEDGVGLLSGQVLSEDDRKELKARMAAAVLDQQAHQERASRFT